VLLHISEETGSFGVAGLVSGVMALVMAAGGPLQGRFVDHDGTRVLNQAASVYVIGMLGVWLVDADESLVVVLGAALAAGAALPNTTSVLRSRWPSILHDRPGAITAAYALDSVLIQFLLVVGPLITALTVPLTGIEGALVVSLVAGFAGTIVFTFVLQVEPFPPGRERAQILDLGALVSPGLRTLVYASVPLGFFIGAVETALPAYGTELDDATLSALLLAVFSAAGMAGGLVYGRRRTSTSLAVTHFALSALLAVAATPLALAWSPATAIVLAVIAGLPVSPVIASRNELVTAVAVRGRAAESFAWPLTAMIVGIALGASAGGALAQDYGWSAAVLAGIAGAACGVLLLAVQRDRLREPAAAGAPG
jgi:MFS family permease